MIKKITLKNYRCFENYTMILKNETLIVGENNAGKSTLVEALRITSVVSKKILKNKIYKNADNSLNLPKNIFGFNIAAEPYKIDLRSIIYFYNENVNAEIIAEFDDKTIFHIYLNTEYIFASIYDKNGKNIHSFNQASKLKFENLEVNIMPHLNLIREKEKKLSVETVEKDQYTYLFSLHFRNEILFFQDNHFKKFKELAETIWPGLKIDEIEYSSDIDEVHLWLKDNQFTAELGLMGSGLQMYLQIIWFISKQSFLSTIILDEPDVYLHPNLQKRIFNYIKDKFNQVIIATHSVELISEADMKNVFQIDKTKRIQNYSKGINNIQSIVENLGSCKCQSFL